MCRVMVTFRPCKFELTVSTGGHARRAARAHLGPVARGPFALGSGKPTNGPTMVHFEGIFYDFFCFVTLKSNGKYIAGVLSLMLHGAMHTLCINKRVAMGTWV